MMESVARNGVVAVSPLCHLKPQAISSFKEGISTILSQWRALQLAVENKWGGNDSLKKSKRLGSDIFSWFSSQSTALCEDLENLLHESLLFTFNTEIEDGSIEEMLGVGTKNFPQPGAASSIKPTRLRKPPTFGPFDGTEAPPTRTSPKATAKKLRIHLHFPLDKLYGGRTVNGFA